MCTEVINHTIPFLKEALTLGEIEDFKPRVDKLMEQAGIPEDYQHPHYELCRSILYGREWYRGDVVLAKKVTDIFLFWYDKCGTLEMLLKEAYKYFHLLGELNFKFFSHLTIIYDRFIMLKP